MGQKVTRHADLRLRRFPWGIYGIVLCLIAGVTLAPIGSVVAAGWFASQHGCRVDEGSVHPCVVDGKDYGQTLYTLGVMGWLMLLTLPAGGLAFAAWLATLLLHRSRWRKRQPPPLPSEVIRT
jgi:hypothetical protein